MATSNEEQDAENIFSGRVPVKIGLDRIRKRLLDLTKRNRLLNFYNLSNQTKTRARLLRIIDTAPDGLFQSLYMDAKTVEILPIPEPERANWVVDQQGTPRKPDVREQAKACGINPDYDLNENGGCNIQTLLYAEDLEAILRKIDQASRTAIEETGTNILHIVFGFLQWYESEDSDTPIFAPLMALPITIKKGSVDRDTGFFRYSIEHSGEDLSENITLRHKLHIDFGLELPQMGEDDTPESYFSKIKQFTETHNRWELKRQVCICLLSFGKLRMYLDLDPDRWPNNGLAEHTIIKTIFEGTDRSATQSFATEYSIDEDPQASAIPLIYDADSSQHSALIDALNGQNMVIEGPPGTGKSQTITNLIAVALARGKTVLFVSEKLAALEVVRRNLDKAGIGKFCLELHSHKTNKKRFLDDIKARKEAQFFDSTELDHKLQEAEAKKLKLKRYVHTINSIKENQLGKSVHEILWSTEFYRLKTKDKATLLSSVDMSFATQTTAVEFTQQLDALGKFVKHFDEIRNCGVDSPWFGYTPYQLLFEDNIKVESLLVKLIEASEEISQFVVSVNTNTGLSLPETEMDYKTFDLFCSKLPTLQEGAAFELLPDLLKPAVWNSILELEKNVMFITENDPQIRRFFHTPEQVGDRDVAIIKEIREKSARANQSKVPYDELAQRAQACTVIANQLNEAFEFFAPVGKALNLAHTTFADIELLRAVITVLAKAPIDGLRLRRYEWFEPSVLRVVQIAHQEADGLKASRSTLNKIFALSVLPDKTQLVNLLGEFEKNVMFITENDPQIRRFFHAPEQVGDRDVAIIKEIREKSARANQSKVPYDELAQRAQACTVIANQLNEAFEFFAPVGKALNLAHTTFADIELLQAVITILAKAPIDGLSLRRYEWFEPSVLRVVQIAHQEADRLKASRGTLNKIFALSALPDRVQLTTSLNVFLEGGGLFRFFKSQLQEASKLYRRIRMGKKTLWLDTLLCAKELTTLIEYLDAKDNFDHSVEIKQVIGPLFSGIDTDFIRITPVVKWQDEVRRQLSGYVTSERRFSLKSLLELPIETIGWVGSLAQESSRHGAIVAGMAKTLEPIFPEVSRPKSIIPTKATSLAEHAIAVSNLSRPLRQYAENLGRLFRETVSPETAGFYISKLLSTRETLANIKKNEITAFLYNSYREGLALDAVLRAKELTTLIEYLDAKDTFDHSAEIKQVIGTLFSGIDTDFTRFTSVVEWQTQAYQQLSGYVTPEGGFSLKSLLELPIETFRWAGSLAQESSRHEPIMADMAKTLKLIFSEISRPEHIVPNTATFIIEHVTCLTNLARSLSQYAENLGRLFRESVNPETAEFYISKLLLIREALANIEKSEAPAFLCNRYAGLATDFSSIKNAMLQSAFIQELVVAPELVSLSDFKQWLLMPDCSSRTKILKNIAKKMEAYWKHIHEIHAAMNEFGQLDWGKWSGTPTPSINDIKKRASKALASIEGLIAWADFSRAERTAREHRLGSIVDFALSSDLKPDEVEFAFQYCFYYFIAKAIMLNNSDLMLFSGLSHTEVRNRFMKLDNEIIRLTGDRCAYQISQRKVPYGNSRGAVSTWTEDALLSNELEKQKRHIPIRQLISRAGNALLALKPCFMMGPLSVAQYLAPGAFKFDIVVMDEASQLKPEEALGAVTRGAQLIVVGDPKQLPPTSFFDRLTAEDEIENDDESIVDDAESILEVCSNMFQPVHRLRWHYRSQHHSLIAFSNRNFYNTRPLIIFPSPYHGAAHGLGIRNHYFTEGVYDDQRNLAEAGRVADAVIEHFRQSQGNSLGVVTLNRPQRDLIEEEIDKRLKIYPQAQEYLARWNEAGYPFFIKNLENVQGDERDVIYISTTFGRAPSGRFAMNFGPINRENGWRRLNVLFTRAKRRVELFTSIDPADIRTDYNTPRGVKELKDYLTYARDGVLETPEILERDYGSDFERSVAEVLHNKGFEVVPQLGVAGFFLDLAVRNPDHQGEYLAGVECDGATYHSGLSVRDRDRLRQEVLERLGWKGKIYRIWSTDWFKNPKVQTDKLLDFLHKAREETRRAPETPNISPTIPEVSDERPQTQVGDFVTYCYTNSPNITHTVQIVRGVSVPERGLLNENTPIAMALIGLRVGEEKYVMLPEGTKTLRVLGIRR